MKKKKVFIIIILTIIVSIMFMNTSNAALQSNNGTKKAYNISDWLKNIRNMEASGGTFGLNAEIDENSLLDKGESNGLDVHMEKNTEYGALAILSASSYGNPEVINSKEKSTTGNSTGVVMENVELVAAITDTMSTNIDSRYKNFYQKDASNKFIFFKGDAMEETKNWNNAAYTDPINIITRFGNYYGWSIFTASSIYENYGQRVFPLDSQLNSRAVVVIGDGI